MVADLPRLSELLPQQYGLSQNLIKLINGLQQPLDQSVEAMKYIQRAMFLGDARGFWLDIIGGRLGLPRQLAEDRSFQYWGFEPAAGGTSPSVGFDQAPIKSVDDTLTAQAGIADAPYRRMLLARSVAITSPPSMAAIEECADILFNSARVVDVAGTDAYVNGVNLGEWDEERLFTDIAIISESEQDREMMLLTLPIRDMLFPKPAGRDLSYMGAVLPLKVWHRSSNHQNGALFMRRSKPYIETYIEVKKEADEQYFGPYSFERPPNAAFVWALGDLGLGSRAFDLDIYPEENDGSVGTTGISHRPGNTVQYWLSDILTHVFIQPIPARAEATDVTFNHFVGVTRKY